MSAALVDNTRTVAARVQSVDLAGTSELERGDGLWAKRLDAADGTSVGVSGEPAQLSGYTRVGPDGLVVDPGERWSLVVGVVSPPAGGRLASFDVAWSRGPFEYVTRTGPAVTVVPVGAACT